MPPAYDPYSQEKLTPGMWETAWEMANPASLLHYKYALSPSTWSVTRGVWNPLKPGVGFKSFTKGVRTAGRLASKEGFLKGAAFSIKGVASSFSLKGSYLGEQYFQRIREVNAFRSNIQGRVFNYFDDFRKAGTFKYVLGKRATALTSHELSSIFTKEVFEWMDEAGDLSRLLPGALKEKIAAKLIDERFIGKYGKIGSADAIMKVLGAAEVSPKGGLKIAERAAKAGIGKHLGKLSASGPGLARLAKGGLMAAKGMAAIGLISTFWDLSQMVAVPVGRMLVQEANRVANAYENRFMPEMGGRLTMSYMSRGAATERQRAVQAISKSYLNGRSAYGAEAALQHS